MTAEPSEAGLAPDALRRLAREHWSQNRPLAALDAAWAAFDRARGERASKRLLHRLLQHHPAALSPDRRADYLALLTDPEVEPDVIATAGWGLVLRRHAAEAAPADDASFEALAAGLQGDALALALLRECPVPHAAAERLLTGLRRWLLLSGRWRHHADLVDALNTQASRNGGAWPFDDDERARFAEAENGEMVASYLPARPGAPGPLANAAPVSDAVTRAVAAQYESWPYPVWTRINMSDPTTLADTIRQLDPDAAKSVPARANILIAGCGSGRQAATIMSQFPDANVTAIDLSRASLDYAQRQCDALGLAGVRFLQLDLHDVARLDRPFDAIYCSGVLHHLPDPERGLRVLSEVLTPGGVMNIMVYSAVARLLVLAARGMVRDLMEQPVNDDLLRQVRRRLIAQAGHPVAAAISGSRDFASLAGVHDMLLNRHEDPFDLPRLKRALAGAGLRVLAFQLATPALAARYDAMFPHDAGHRDLDLLARFELSRSGAIVGNYQLWCRSSPSEPGRA